MAGDIRRIFDFGDVILIHEVKLCITNCFACCITSLQATSALYNEIVAQVKKQKLESISSKNQHLVRVFENCCTHNSIRQISGPIVATFMGIFIWFERGYKSSMWLYSDRINKGEDTGERFGSATVAQFSENFKVSNFNYAEKSIYLFRFFKVPEFLTTNVGRSDNLAILEGT